MKPEYKPLSAEAYFIAGNEKSKSGDYKGAIADYTAAIRFCACLLQPGRDKRQTRSDIGGNVRFPNLQENLQKQVWQYQSLAQSPFTVTRNFNYVELLSIQANAVDVRVSEACEFESLMSWVYLQADFLLKRSLKKCRIWKPKIFLPASSLLHIKWTLP